MRNLRPKIFSFIGNYSSEDLPLEQKNRFICADHFIHSLLIIVVIGLLSLITINLSSFDPIQRALADFEITDVYFSIIHHPENSQLDSTIVIVDLTNIHERDSIALLLEEVANCSPRIVACDLIFQGNRTFEGDNALINSMSQLPCPVVATKLTNYKPDSTLFTHQVNSFFADIIPVHQGYVNMLENIPGGCLRRYSCWQLYHNDTIFSFPYLTASLYQHKRPEVVEDNDQLVIFSNSKFIVLNPDSIQYYPNLLKDKIVLIGSVGEESDTHITPIGKLSGVHIMAYTIQTVLRHGKASKMSSLTAILFTFFLCYFAAWLGYRIKTIKNSHIYLIRLFYFVLTSAIVALGLFSFVYLDYQISMIFPLLGIALVEEIRTHYSWCVNYIHRHPHLKELNRWAKKSIYY